LKTAEKIKKLRIVFTAPALPTSSMTGEKAREMNGLRS